MSITSLFLALINGKTLHILEEEGGGQELPNFFSKGDGKYSFIKLTPSHLKMLECLPQKRWEERVKAFVIGGEKLTQSHIKYWQQKLPSIDLYNEYGPTEATVACCVFKISKSYNSFDPLPIGKPIDNTEIYILDEQMREVGIGIPGEIYIGGVGLARGYINNPELTKEKFVENPFSEDKSSRLYKTGDLGRYLEDGNIQYLGRIDNQIKLRGYRIEPGEIETYIERHEGVKACVVLVKKDNKGHESLVAYVVLEEKGKHGEHLAERKTEQLRQELRQKLPEYMIPNYFIEVDELPLNANGKIDRKKLPELDAVGWEKERKIILPRNNTEKDLVNLWKKILPTKDIGISDNFFELGGHSMLMTQVIVHILKEYGVDLPLRPFFEEPTIARLSHVIKDKKNLLSSDALHILMQDTQLEKVLENPAKIASFVRKKNEESTILLTGATGFLGIHLLSELCQQQYQKIYCLVREKNELAATKKILKAAAHYGVNIQPSFMNIIIPVLGDIEKPLLGISESNYKKLEKEVDIIFHNAAFVNHILDYQKLRKSNVLGTKEIIKLAFSHKQKKVNYVSTLSNYLIDSNGYIAEKLPEQYDFKTLAAGYALTKAVSEIVLCKAMREGLPLTVFRPNYILGGETKSKNLQESRHLLSLIKGCIQMGFAPDWETVLDLSSANFLAMLIVRIEEYNSNKTVYNLTNPHKLKWIDLIKFLQNKGYKLEIITEKEWKKMLMSHVDQENALYPFLSIYLQERDENEKSQSVIVMDKNLSEFMKVKNQEWPIVDEHFIEECILPHLN